MLRTFKLIFLIVLAVVVFVVMPIWAVVGFWTWLNTKPSERPERRGGGSGGVVGGMMIGVDKLIRPSAEFRVEAENPVVKEDEEGGE